MIYKILLDILSSRTTYGKPGGLYLNGPTIFVLPTLAILAAIFVGSLVWLYKDSTARGKNPIISIVLVLLFGWPVSFVWWFWLRPPLRETLSVFHTGSALPRVPSPSKI